MAELRNVEKVLPKTLLEVLMNKIHLIKKSGSPVYAERPLSNIEILLEKRLANIVLYLQEVDLLSQITYPVHDFADEPFQFLVGITGNSGGADFYSLEKACWKAVAETAERELWYRKPLPQLKTTNISTANYSEMISRYGKKKVLDIFSLAGFTEDQKKQGDTGFNEKTKFQWTLAKTLTKSGPLWCPIQLLSGYYAKKSEEPILRKPITTGLATGQSKTAACLKGLLEIIERDAFMNCYLNYVISPRLNIEELKKRSSSMKKVLEKFTAYNLEVNFILLETDFPVHVVLCVVVDNSHVGPYITVGARADFSVEMAANDSLNEALAVRYSVRTAMEQNKKTESMNKQGRLRYWSNSKNDFSGYDKAILTGKTTYPEKDGLSVRNMDTLETSKCLKELAKIFDDKNYDVLHTDISTKKLQKLGLHSVFVMIPDLQPLHLDEEYSCFGGKRLEEMAKKTSLKRHKTMLNTIPHPFP